MTEYLKSSGLTPPRATTVIVEAEEEVGREAIGEEEGTLIAALLLLG